ncbi:putative cytochrome P450 cyp-13B1 [Rhipicephalus sanguineus]|uniref:putative cytochrome P450 cyp-13B1 n=1 Tax=Rhipicephalus sanguineus TaxID=34632 RepID=UPI0020C58A51|nr:putative cytochrome P450 cyp-13B1 [Rhipicephalus sanguineus]
MGPCSSKWLKQYGDVVGYYNGAMPGIVLRDRELIKRIFINDFQYFTARQIMALVSKNLPVNEVRYSRVSGDDWRYLKNIMLPAFKTNNIKKDCVAEAATVRPRDGATVGAVIIIIIMNTGSGEKG